MSQGGGEFRDGEHGAFIVKAGDAAQQIILWSSTNKIYTPVQFPAPMLPDSIVAS